MFRKTLRIFVFLMILFSFVQINSSCTYLSPLVGTWRDSQGQGTIQFMSNGNVILKTENFVITGKWQNVSNDVINLSLDGGTGGILDPGGADSWQYTISGNTMTVVAGGSGDVFYRVIKSTTQIVQTARPTTKITSTTTTNIKPSITVIYPTGGEVFHVGQSVTVKWVSTNLSNSIPLTIVFGLPNGNFLPIIGTQTVLNTGSYSLNIPQSISGYSLIGAKVRISIGSVNSDTNGAGDFSGYFTITQ